MKRTTAFCLPLFLLVAGHTSMAQQTTEVYIPIDQSPGISGKASLVGSISSVDHESYSVTITVAGESKTVTMTPATRYYVIRTGGKKQNSTGSYEDCEVGRRMEAYLDEDGNAVWVKIEVSDRG